MSKMSNKSICIREDYIDATERCALMAEQILKDKIVDKKDLAMKIRRWRELRRQVMIE